MQHHARHTVSRSSTESGFSLVELLIAMTITLTALGISLTALTSVSRAREASSLLTDGNQSLRSTLNLMTRDLLVAGRLVPVGGISIPSGAGSVALVRPSQTGTAMTFPAGDTALPAVSPANALGPTINGTSTDMVSILMIDTATLCGTTNRLDSLNLANIANDGSSATVDPAMTISCTGNGITAGDLIMFKAGGTGETLMMVTAVNGRTMSFAPGDPMNLNQPGAAAGTILQLHDTPTTYPLNTKAYRVYMISYYIYVDPATPNKPQLMRRVNLRPDRAIGIGIENLQYTWDVVDGATNPVNVAAPTAAQRNQVRKANVFVSGRSRTVWTQSRQYIRTSLSTQVSLRSLSFVDRYNPTL
ncbi:MAG: prepilin-type N-terminal cleavage/methylation domain-containing protein [Vicinamibacterales bacterium]